MYSPVFACIHFFESVFDFLEESGRWWSVGRGEGREEEWGAGCGEGREETWGARRSGVREGKSRR